MGIYIIKDQVPECDVEKLVDFLRVAWKPDHALIKSRDLLNFQHLDKDKRAYNFIVAENQQTGEYDALVGYIPVAHYDPALREYGDYWGGIWKRKDDVFNDEINTIGAEVYQHFFTLPYFKSQCGISLSDIAVKACRAMRYKFGYLHQYYILNKYSSSFCIANNVSSNHFINPSQGKSQNWSIKWIDFITVMNSGVSPKYRPYKSLKFIENRYYRHPIYHYDYLGLYYNACLKAILVTRTIEENYSKVLRIVDAYGDLGGYIYPSMQRILQESGYEYVDFLNYGIDKNVFTEMGFNELDFENDSLVLPNYFEPFERRNVKMTVVHKDKYENYVAFKGDADQDRPNIII